jgi:glutamate synthase (NADPH) small chain
MSATVLNEAKRCLQCKNPLCKKGCPVSTAVPEMMKLFLDGKMHEAGEMLFANNPLSIICSLICPHSRQCEGHCVLNKKGNPIQVGMVEHYISDYFLNYISTPLKKDPEKKVGIIGSGPAGITIAFILASRGYDITLFDAHDKIGGVLRYGIPEFRLSKSILDKMKEKLVAIGVRIRPNTNIGPVITIDNLFRDGYKAVFIGTGVWRPNGLTLKGESLGNVHYAIDYLKNPEVYDLGKNVCVVGAGNVAMDVARTVLRHGVRRVTILFRGGGEHVEADRVEMEYAKIDGVEFEFYKQPLEFTETGVKYIHTQVEQSEEGQLLFERIEGSEDMFECDSIIVSVGQGPRDILVNTTEGLNVTKRGLLETDQQGRTTREGVFASGDVVTGAKTVVEAVRVSKIVADEIDEYVNCLIEKGKNTGEDCAC